MTFIDTNFFLRFLLDDLPNQKDEAVKLFTKASSGQEKLVTNIIVIFEIYWVVKNLYGVKHSLTKQFLTKVCNFSFVYLDNKQIIIKAIENFHKFNYDLEDSYHYYFCQSKNINNIATFDKKLKNKFKKLK